MIHLSPRFFVLPLIALAVIALAVIVSLPRNADTATAKRASAGHALSCASPSSTPCVAAAASRTIVR